MAKMTLEQCKRKFKEAWIGHAEADARYVEFLSGVFVRNEALGGLIRGTQACKLDEYNDRPLVTSYAVCNGDPQLYRVDSNGKAYVKETRSYKTVCCNCPTADSISGLCNIHCPFATRQAQKYGEDCWGRPIPLANSDWNMARKLEKQLCKAAGRVFDLRLKLFGEFKLTADDYRALLEECESQSTLKTA